MVFTLCRFVLSRLRSAGAGESEWTGQRSPPPARRTEANRMLDTRVSHSSSGPFAPGRDFFQGGGAEALRDPGSRRVGGHELGGAETQGRFKAQSSKLKTQNSKLKAQSSREAPREAPRVQGSKRLEHGWRATPRGGCRDGRGAGRKEWADVQRRREERKCRLEARTTGSGAERRPVDAGGVPDGSRRSLRGGDLRSREPGPRHPGGGARGPGSRHLACLREGLARARPPLGRLARGQGSASVQSRPRACRWRRTSSRSHTCSRRASTLTASCRPSGLNASGAIVLGSGSCGARDPAV